MKLGLIINPVAGVGGSVALKGSDGVVEEALARGAVKQANNRTRTALEPLLALKDQLSFVTASGEMGADLLAEMGFTFEVAYQAPLETTAEDSKAAAQALLAAQVELLLFAGGDGTARDICSVVEEKLPVLGVPAGCKIHSGVYAVTPKAAGELIASLHQGELLSLIEADVMDIDETQFREGVVRAKRFGEMCIPASLRYVQAVKQGGKESDELVLHDIAAEVISRMEPGRRYVMGSGSTVAFIMAELGLPNTLLGVDLVEDEQLIASDLTEAQLFEALRPGTQLVITLIGGQGHLFGRGNQQLSPRVIRAIGRENILVVATKRKLQALEGRPLIIDTGDAALDVELTGIYPIITGYRDSVMYRAANPTD
ncbi:ATP-NAD kinase family protein [Gallaecimonas kandeliae]|uniref:ATP-NAD kinase family protein n=1 Tax=Gallaecimonas kandeliae TaxID=3029055 RepID=UPI002649067E|nr:ATP-NAD kinase family protein [Gallaecimonas kandeliae]WKE64168.1 ATP-NAD kinase family protein [Gallaecimonas kandeliae]